MPFVYTRNFRGVPLVEVTIKYKINKWSCKFDFVVPPIGKTMWSSSNSSNCGLYLLMKGA